MINLALNSSGFPAGGPSGESELQITSAKLCWAALTVGKPNKFALKAFGDYSKSEALFRWNMVKSAIDLQAGTNSELFNSMDPTEKGWINFNLGMIFLKICAQDVLKVPWLIHLNWMEENHDLTSLMGNTSPDFVGYSHSTARWGVFEAKGRNGRLDRKLLASAKKQAKHLIKVDGEMCDQQVGGMLYRLKGGKLAYAWEDPAPDGEGGYELKTCRQTWREYYQPAFELYNEQQKAPTEFHKEHGFKIGFNQEALMLIDAINGEGDFAGELESLFFWSMEQILQPKEPWNADGIKIEISNGQIDA